MLNKIADLISDNLGLLGTLAFVLVGAWQIFKRKKESKIAIKKLDDAIKAQLNEPLTLHPEVNPTICAGCAACSKVCPEGDILKVINHKAVLISPTKCVGHGECERACPTGAISLVFGTKTRGMDIPRITNDYETNVPGLYIAGELGGMGLIRNAFKQGSWAASHAIANLKKDIKTDTSLLIVGAGPAGMAAALTAIAKNQSYICIEQNTFGGTIANFPRQKIVMTHPAEIPGVWKMKFPKNKTRKEVLLNLWHEIKKERKLEVREGVKFELVQKKEKHFIVKTNQGEITAQKVLLCTGVRGTPRRLGLKNEDLPKVTYNLIDPEQYQEQNVVIVGGGNAGVEAAQMLAKREYRNKVTLLVRGSTFDRCNEENKKIIEKMAGEGLVQIWFKSEVKEIQPESLLIKRQEELVNVPNDYLFVYAGAEMPHKFLMSLGVEIEKKFGTSL